MGLPSTTWYLKPNHMVDSQELACTESFLFPWHFPAPCSRTFRDFEEAFVQPAKFQKIGQRWLHDPRGPTLPSLKDELMSASILKASLLCNSAPMQQCSHVNSISPWAPKCFSLLDLPDIPYGTCQVLDHHPTPLRHLFVHPSHVSPRFSFPPTMEPPFLQAPYASGTSEEGTIKKLRAKCFPGLLSRTKAEYCRVCCVGPLPASSSQASSSVFSLERRVFRPLHSSHNFCRN